MSLVRYAENADTLLSALWVVFAYQKLAGAEPDSDMQDLLTDVAGAMAGYGRATLAQELRFLAEVLNATAGAIQ